MQYVICIFDLLQIEKRENRGSRGVCRKNFQKESAVLRICGLNNIPNSYNIQYLVLVFEENERHD